ncbi:MAG TPA: hypothetical protein PK367_03400 [Candidatus Paceibacterota bacterium]|nr:hypothetical protein [Candidatus Pacearchaeota archaeon]HPW34771.1 hypothetical protein [Candidatus Paceibacterota bacterium]
MVLLEAIYSLILAVIPVISDNWISFCNNLTKWVLAIAGYQYSGWIFSGILITIFVVFLWRMKKKNKGCAITFISAPPSQEHFRYGKPELFNVSWDLWSGSDSLFDSGPEHERVWVDGPYCIENDCGYELDREGDKWVCAKCGKNYKIPKHIQNDTRDKVIKIFESEIKKIPGKA